MNDPCRATLFDLNTDHIARVDYVEMDGLFYLINFKGVGGAYPKQVFILLDGSDTPFLISLFELHGVDGAPEGSELVGRRIVPDCHENVRQDVRVPVVMDIKVSSPAFPKAKQAQMRNLSSSGLMFVSDEVYEKDAVLSLTIPITEPPIQLAAVVKNKIPIRSGMVQNTIGYGCMFAIIDQKTESKIRQFVFQQELLRRRNASYD